MKKIILTFLFLIFTIYTRAGFTLSGTTITQTGTDNDLSGLAAISGVTVIQEGAGSTTEYTIYNIGDRNLLINGTLSIDASKEMLLIGSVFPTDAGGDLLTSIISVAGTLNINDVETINGFSAYRQRTAIRVTYSNFNICCDSFSFDVTNSGTFNMQGGGLEISSSIKFQTNSIINIQEGRIEQLSNPHPQYQIRQFSNNLTALNFRAVKFALTMVGTPIQFDGYIPTHGDNGISFSSSSSNTEYVFRDYSGGGRGNRLDLGLWSSRKGKIINSSDGTNVIVQEHLIGNANSTGTWQITKEIAPTILDENSNPIENVKMFIRDTDNGNRTDGNGYNFSDDRTYFESSDANGLIPTTEVLTGNVNHLNTGAVIFDRRSKNNNTDDEFDILFYHYNKVLSKSIQKLKGRGELTFEWTMFGDPNITEQDVTVVAGYNTIDDLGQLYDYSKYWKQINQTNIEIPSTDELLINNESSMLDLEDYNLIVDANAGSVFSVDVNTKTITIKSNALLTNSKFKGIITTGTITINNGATLEHGYIDSTGTNKFVNLKWNQISTNDIYIINKDDDSNITPLIVASNFYKGHFLVPNPTPTNGIELQINIQNSPIQLYKETIPEDDINFIRLDMDLIDIGTELNQHKMLAISQRLLVKIEALNNAMNNTTTPTLTINQTISGNPFEDGTYTNQLAMLSLLKRLLSKVTAAREALKK